MKKPAILFTIIATTFINAHAESITDLNTTLSVMNSKHAITKNVKVIPYVGKDITVSQTVDLQISSRQTIVC